MAGSCKNCSSRTCVNFKLENVDLNSIELLSDQAYLVYNYQHIKWTQDLHSLKEFAKHVIGLTGIWRSLGCKAKQLPSLNADFVLTWYPGQHNTLRFNGKDGEMCKDLLLSS